ncbi:MAG: hypothetical protein HJHJAOHD_00305 [Flavobacteriales bacterium]|nr:hypothetical protein [Flavobacteriales bacterium]WKZ74573.1 MAG: FtsX-like permease family protein [Vicingaceae bacterium]
MIYLKLAWKNIWRNKRRSFITIGSILFAVFFAVFMRSMQLGMYAKMIDSVVRSYYGYVQVHAKGYWEEQSLDNSFERKSDDEKAISSSENVLNIIPRLEGFALLAAGDKVRGVSLSGIVPDSENELSGLKSKIVKGTYLEKNYNEVVIGEGIAEQLNVKVNDTIAMISQGYHAVSASGKFVVKGIAKFSSSQINNTAVFAPLSVTQDFYSTGNRLTSYALQLKEGSDSKYTIGKLSKNTDNNIYEVLPWEEMLPELVQIIQADSAGGEIMVFILYMVISFGIFGTILMMIAERQYEFGILLSIGMSRAKLILVLLLESIMITLIGVLSGILVSRPFMYYFNAHPITLTGRAADTLRKFGFEPEMPTLLDFSVPLTHGTAVLMIAITLSLYSVISILKLDPVKAAKR